MPTPAPQPPVEASTLTPQAADKQVFIATEMMKFGRELAKIIAEWLVLVLGASIALSNLDESLGPVVTKTLGTLVERQTREPSKPSQSMTNQSRGKLTTPTRVQAQAPPTTAPAGLTPASLRIEQERKALGLPTDPRFQRQLTCLKASSSSSGTT